jgi:hypothetical protein
MLWPRSRASSPKAPTSQYAPPEPQRTRTETLEIMTRAIRRREAEPLATQQLDQMNMPAVAKSQISLTPLTELIEAGADHAAYQASNGKFKQQPPNPPNREPDWQHARQRADDNHHRHGREL